MEAINLAQKISIIPAYWSPKIIAELNGSQVKLARLKGEFVWHHHDLEDELFLVIKGSLIIRLRDDTIHLAPGELVVIPHGVEHQPVAEEEVHVLLLEPKGTLNTGNIQDEHTVDADWI